MSSSSPRRRVVVVGGGYVGAPLARSLDADHDVILIDKLPVFFHRMAALRAAVDPGSTDLPFLSRDGLLTKGKVVTGEVVGIDPDDRIIRLADGSAIGYDVAILATGAINQRVAQFDGVDVTSAQQHFEELQREIAASREIAIIGGGVTGVELAGEITAAHPDKPVVLFTRHRLVPSLPEKAAASLTAQLTDRGVRVVTGHAVTIETLPEALRAADLDPEGTLVLWTVGGAPAVEWLRATHPDWVGEGGVIVDEFLRVGGRNDLYAVGDVAATPGTKGAMVARRQIPVIAANIAASAPTKTYAFTGPQISLVPLGPEGGVVSIGLGKRNLLLGARAASAAKGKTLMTPMMKKALGDAS